MVGHLTAICAGEVDKIAELPLSDDCVVQHLGWPFGRPSVEKVCPEVVA